MLTMRNNPFLKYFCKYFWFVVVMSIAVDGLVYIADLISIKIIGKWSDLAVYETKKLLNISTYDIITLICAILSIVAICPILLYLINKKLLKRTVFFDKKVLELFLQNKYEDILNQDLNNYEYKIENDAINFRLGLNDILTSGVVQFGFLFIIIMTLINIHIVFTVLTLIIMLLQVVIPIITNKKRLNYVTETKRENEKLFKSECNIINNYGYIKQSMLSNSIINKLKEDYDKYYNGIFKRKLKFDSILNLINMIIPFMAWVCIFIIGAYFISLNKITVGNLVVFLGVASLLKGVFEEIIRLIGLIADFLVTNNRLLTLCHKCNCPSTDKNISFKETIEIIQLTGLSYEYPNGKKIKYNDITIKKNNNVIITGENGSGKTTLANILCGLFERYEGSIIVNEYQLHNISYNDYKKQILYLPSTFFCFDNMTVYENIKILSDTNDSTKLKQMLKYFGIYNLMDSIIENQGNNLSNGQKKKIMLIVALLSNKSFLILDEPTNYLDSNSVDYFIDYINNDDQKTYLIISHDEKLIKGISKSNIYLVGT